MISRVTDGTTNKQYAMTSIYTYIDVERKALLALSHVLTALLFEWYIYIYMGRKEGVRVEEEQQRQQLRTNRAAGRSYHELFRSRPDALQQY